MTKRVTVVLPLTQVQLEVLRFCLMYTGECVYEMDDEMVDDPKYIDKIIGSIWDMLPPTDRVPDLTTKP